MVRDWDLAALDGLSPEAFLEEEESLLLRAAAEATEELEDIHAEVCVRVCVCVCMCVCESQALA